MRAKLVILCKPALRLNVMLMASRREISVSRLAEAAMLVFDSEIHSYIDDPGEGVSQLVLRLPSAADPALVRRALQRMVRESLHREDPVTLGKRIDDLRAQVDALRDGVEKLAFTPIAGGVRKPGDAAHILGLEFTGELDEELINRRFRELAPVYHPDTGIVSGSRHMAQLIDARKLLLRHLMKSSPDA